MNPLNSKIISYLPSQPDFEFQTDYYTEQKLELNQINHLFCFTNLKWEG